MRLRSSTMVCREGLYYFLVLGFVTTGAVVRDINLLMVVAGMMVGPLLYSWRSVVVTLRSIKLRREVPEAICAGDLLVVRIQITNTMPRRNAWAVSVEDSIRQKIGPGRGEQTKVGVLFEHVPPLGTRNRTYSGRLTRRGRYEFTQLTASTRFPLGLLRRTMRLRINEKLTVYPRVGRLSGRWTRLHQQQAQGGQRVRRRHGAMEGDFFGLRDWRPGDSRRWIHWKTSARRGALVVRQFEQQRNEDLLLLLDLWLPPDADEAQREAVERVVSFAATAVADLCRKGNCRLLLGIGGEKLDVHDGVASMAMREELMKRLAFCEATDGDRLEELIAECFPRMHPSASTVIVATRPTDLSEQKRFAHLPDAIGSQLLSRRILCLDTVGPELADYFEVE